MALSSIFILDKAKSNARFGFIKDHTLSGQNDWPAYVDSPKYRAWSGYSFEQVCLYHLPQIKTALGISGVQTSVSSWRSSTKDHGVQIDLVVDRRETGTRKSVFLTLITTYGIQSDQYSAGLVQNDLKMDILYIS